MAASFPNPSHWYRLSISSLPGVCLDVINDGTHLEQGKLQMAPIGNYSGQHWQFLPLPDGSFQMRAIFTGTDRFLFGDGVDARLSQNARNGGNRWYLERIATDEGSPARFRLRVDLAGTSASDGQYYIGPRPHPDWFNGQRLHTMRPDQASSPDILEWTVTEIKPISYPEFQFTPQTTSGIFGAASTNINGSLIDL